MNGGKFFELREHARIGTDYDFRRRIRLAAEHPCANFACRANAAADDLRAPSIAMYDVARFDFAVQNAFTDRNVSRDVNNRVLHEFRDQRSAGGFHFRALHAAAYDDVAFRFDLRLLYGTADFHVARGFDFETVEHAAADDHRSEKHNISGFRTDVAHHAIHRFHRDAPARIHHLAVNFSDQLAAVFGEDRAAALTEFDVFSVTRFDDAVKDRTTGLTHRRGNFFSEHLTDHDVFDQVHLLKVDAALRVFFEVNRIFFDVNFIIDARVLAVFSRHAFRREYFLHVTIVEQGRV